MTEVEKWVDNYKKEHTWQETIVEILRLYELSPMIQRLHPYSAFSSVLKVAYGVSDEPSWSYELKNSAVNEFRVRVISLYKTVAANVLVKDDMSITTIARVLATELFSNAEVPYTAKEVSDYCKDYIDAEDEKSMLYFFAGVTLCSNTNNKTAIATILSSIAYRLVFNCNIMIRAPKGLPIKISKFDCAEDYAVFGKSLYKD